MVEETWTAINGLNTTYQTVVAAPANSPTVEKADTVVVHATGIV